MVEKYDFLEECNKTLDSKIDKMFTEAEKKAYKQMLINGVIALDDPSGENTSELMKEKEELLKEIKETKDIGQNLISISKKLTDAIAAKKKKKTRDRLNKERLDREKSKRRSKNKHIKKNNKNKRKK